MKNRRKICATALSALIPVIASFLALGQSKNQENPNEIWYDVPSAPLKFNVPPFDPKYVEMQMVEIHSTVGKITEYSLGCIRKDGAQVAMTRIVRTWRINQPPEDQMFPSHVLRITAIPCVKQKESLAVVKVEYEDGAVWQLAGNREQTKLTTDSD